MMKPSEVFKMRNTLADEMAAALSGDMTESELADWLIETGWVTEVPNEDTN